MILGQHQFEFKKASFKENYISKTIFEVDLVEGINQQSDLIIWKNKSNIKIYDRVCDHNGGRLITNLGTITCPLHGWVFDPKSGSYCNVECSKKPLYEGNLTLGGKVDVKIPEYNRELEGFKQNIDFQIRYLNHACLVFSTPTLKFASDPWIIGSAFSNGWWLSSQSPVDSFKELNSCDFIYISHNHPDHLHIETLKRIRKDIPILTGNFLSQSTSGFLNEIGFKNVKALNFDEKWLHKDQNIALSVMKSGDFRDDSGLLLEIGKKTIMLNVDSNYIDFWRFPNSVDLLASSFAGGASGFPLCFDDYTDDEKKRILLRNKKSIYTTNKMVMQKLKPKMFLPYAGFFKEKATRDQYISKENIKNTIETYEDVCSNLNIDLINVIKTPILRFKDTNIEKVKYKGKFLEKEVPDQIINSDKIDNKLNAQNIMDYFKRSEFYYNLDLKLIPTDDAFTPLDDFFYISFFKGQNPKVNYKLELPRRVAVNYLEIYARASELSKVIERGLPWEDLSIGFQCRIKRDPNVYNSKFWHHFTNIYVSSNVIRRSKDCSGCEIFAQNIF